LFHDLQLEKTKTTLVTGSPKSRHSNGVGPNSCIKMSGGQPFEQF